MPNFTFWNTTYWQIFLSTICVSLQAISLVEPAEDEVLLNFIRTLSPATTAEMVSKESSQAQSDNSDSNIPFPFLIYETDDHDKIISTPDEKKDEEPPPSSFMVFIENMTCYPKRVNKRSEPKTEWLNYWHKLKIIFDSPAFPCFK